MAYDLRGHGMSEAPLEPEHYTDARLWADDVAAIIDQLRPRPARARRLVVRRLRHLRLRPRATARIESRPINFVEGAVKLGEAAFGTLIGPGFLDHFADATADDLPTNIRAMRGLRHALARRSRSRPTTSRRRCAGTSSCRRTSAPTSPPARSTATTCSAPSRCRCWSRTAGRTRVVLPAMAEHVLATCPTAEASWYDGVGHVPHLEEPERFNRELAALTRRVRA